MYVKCWDCGQEIETKDLTNDQYIQAYDRGYMQALRDMKSAKI